MLGYQLYNKDARNMSELPDDSIQMVCTSPPYWGLRNYAGEQELIWNSRNGCQHEWGDAIIRKNRGSVGATVTVGANKRELQGNSTNQGNTCSACGAWRGAFGHEPTPELYIQHSVEILRDVRRVLRPDGVVWWNIGDSYSGSWGDYVAPGSVKHQGQSPSRWERPSYDKYHQRPPTAAHHPVIKSKDLCLIPQRLAIALQEDGWWVRSLIIWNKTNPMPESVNGWRWERHRVKVKAQPQERSQKARLGQLQDEGWTRPDNIGGVYIQRAEFIDCPGCPKCSPNDGYVLRKGSWRPTESHEYILMLAKSDNYYCNMEAVREPSISTDFGSDQRDTSITHGMGSGNSGINEAKRRARENGTFGGRNLRSVWTFPTRPFPGAHFAVFPEKLPELCIKAATPEVGVCAKCGAPWARVINHHRPADYDPGVVDENYAGQASKASGTDGTNRPLSKMFQDSLGSSIETIGWKPTCRCGTDDRVPATVLDPFCGAGTTLLVALRLGRSAVGYDLAAQYLEMTRERLNGIKLEMVPTIGRFC